ncbi:alanine aminotransferase, partial [Candidatus Bathyarchaeota archaeon]
MSVEYAIRDVVLPARELERKGRKILYLNIGDPLKFDFDTPEHIKEALYKAAREGKNWYGPSEGLPELREAICEKEKRYNNVDIGPEDVVVTTGVSEAINFLMAAALEPGDEVLVPGPTYPPYISYAKLYDAKPISYRTIEEEGWRPDVDDLRSKVSERTKLIVLINPNNPCGAVYDEKTVRAILDVAGEHGLLVASDEIYDRIVFEGRFRSTASLAKDVPVVGLNGFSKVYLMTGWRLGYLYFHGPEGVLAELKEAVLRLARVRLCPNTPVQVAAVEALRGPQDHVREMVEKLRERRDLAYKRLSEIEGISTARPEGAFYIFPRVEGIGSIWKTDKDFVLELLR